MNTVTLYKIHSGFNNVRNTFELEKHFADEEKGDFGAEYTLPEGYTVGENIVGRPMIFDQTGIGCEITEHTSGRPQLFSRFGTSPVLAAVA